jgi:quercetin dioxygenase-like cupin family protein
MRVRLNSGPGRDLIFKVTGEDTGGAFDYFIVEVAPKGGPPLHVHYLQEETIHVLKGGIKSGLATRSSTVMKEASPIFLRKSPTPF